MIQQAAADLSRALFRPRTYFENSRSELWPGVVGLMLLLLAVCALSLFAIAWANQENISRAGMELYEKAWPEDQGFPVTRPKDFAYDPTNAPWFGLYWLVLISLSVFVRYGAIRLLGDQATLPYVTILTLYAAVPLVLGAWAATAAAL